MKYYSLLVPHETLLMICKVLIQPNFDYCTSVWGSLGVCRSETSKTPNRAARLIAFSDLNVRSFSLLGDLESGGCTRNRPFAF